MPLGLPASLLPVLDLKDGLVVRGVAGERHRYQPVSSCFATDAQPISVARALKEKFGFTLVYVADLNAIAGEEPNWAAWDEIAGCGQRLVVDAGVGSPERAERIRTWDAEREVLDGVVVALESLRQPDSLSELLGLIGPQHAVFSLDLKHGLPITAIDAWRQTAPLEIVERAIRAGFRRLIVLDLAAVGVGQGPTVTGICQAMREKHHHLEITSGGGVRNLSDVEQFRQAGCDRVLVASALHDGRICMEALKRE